MLHDVFEKTIDFGTYVWTIDFIVDPRTQYEFDGSYWKVHIVDIPEFMGYLKDNPLNGGYSDSPSGWFCLEPIKEGNTSLWTAKGESHWVNIVEHLN